VGAKKSSNRAPSQMIEPVFDASNGLLPLASDSETKPKAKPGPNTLGDSQLIARRSRWVFLLENNWGAIGWELKCARTPEAIHEAFRPLASKPVAQEIQPFLRDSTEIADGAAVRRAEKEYLAALLKESQIEKKRNDQQALVREAESAVSELTGKTRKQLNEQIIWRNGNVRTIAIRLSGRRAEVRKLELKLQKATAENRDYLAAQLNSAKLECDKIEIELSIEKGIVQDLQTRLAAISTVRQQAAAKILRERKANAASIESDARSAQRKSEALRMRLLDREAYFCRSELLKIIRGKKYARNPQKLANALAGLPVMTCGQSAKRFAKYPYKIAPGLAGQLFEFLDRTWRRADSKSRKFPLQLFEQAIAKLPKTRILRAEGKGKTIENEFRRHLEESWPDLKPAIDYGVRISKHPNEVPYRIAEKFRENWSKPKTSADLLFAERGAAK